MPQSMTAFARVTHQDDWGTLSWEIRSVNHRYLEPNFRIPDTLRDVEMDLRETLRQFLSRGKVDCSLQLQLNREQEGVAVNISKAQQYINAAAQVAGLMDNPSAISPIAILDRPGVLEEREIDGEILKKATVALFKTAVAQLVENRAVEGGKLAAFILQRVDSIRSETEKVRNLLPQILAAQKQRLNDKISDLQLNLDPERLEQEIVILAQKADVDEELDRLGAHLSEIEQVMTRKEPIGRRLDFLMQELNRETNTLSSKSIATDTTQSAVELKVLIEQMREQIQNIE
ncbi:MAG: YicC family protein [Porticoccaceae bacterium]|nr:YicC family protein [Porticoccaceae bacterium]